MNHFLDARLMIVCAFLTGNGIDLLRVGRIVVIIVVEAVSEHGFVFSVVFVCVGVVNSVLRFVVNIFRFVIFIVVVIVVVIVIVMIIILVFVFIVVFVLTIVPVTSTGRNLRIRSLWCVSNI